MTPTSVDPLLRSVVTRLAWARWARRAYTAFLWVAAAWLLFVLADRLMGWGTWWAGSVAALIAVPVLAAALGFVGYRRPQDLDAAREVDRAAGSKDLFLTEVHTRNERDGFAPVVHSRAAQVAATVTPSAVVPFAASSRWAKVAGALVVVLAAAQFVPMMDLWDSFGQQREEQQAKRALEERTAEAEKKAETLARKQVQAENSPMVAAAVQRLEKTFQQMERPKPQENDKRLAAEQRELGEAWRRMREQGLSKFGQRSDQQFGGSRDSQSQEWKEQLKKGSTAALQKEISDIAKEAKDLAENKDGMSEEEQAKAAQKLREKLQKLEEFARAEGSTPGMKDALAKMQQALSDMQTPGLESEALAGLEAAANLAQMEAGALAQLARDLESLEQSLEALRAARALNGEQPLDGADCGECEGGGMEAYEALYREMLAKYGNGSGQGEGMKGPGIGEGGLAESDESLETGFVPERARTHLTAGKILMEMAEERAGTGGEVARSRDAAVAEVIEGVGEAILREEVPPAYHGTVQGYFDRLGLTRKEQPPSGAGDNGALGGKDNK